MTILVNVIAVFVLLAYLRWLYNEYKLDVRVANFWKQNKRCVQQECEMRKKEQSVLKTYEWMRSIGREHEARIFLLTSGLRSTFLEAYNKEDKS